MGKRYRIDRTPGHYVQRDRKGRFKEWTNIPRSIAIDAAKKAKQKKPTSEYGYGHRVDYNLPRLGIGLKTGAAGKRRAGQPRSLHERILRHVLQLKAGQTWYPFKGERLPRVDVTEDYIHVRLHYPSRYTKFRYHDLGRKGHSQRRAGITEDGAWETQAWIFERDELADDPKMQQLFTQVVGEARG